MKFNSKLSILSFVPSYFRIKRVKSFTAPTKPTSVLDDGIDEEDEFDPIPSRPPKPTLGSGASQRESVTKKESADAAEEDAKRHIKALERQMKARIKSKKVKGVPIQPREVQQSPLGDSAVEMPYQSLIDQVGPDVRNAELRR